MPTRTTRTSSASGACSGAARARRRSRATSARCARRRSAASENEDVDAGVRRPRVAWYARREARLAASSACRSGPQRRHAARQRPPRPRAGCSRGDRRLRQRRGRPRPRRPRRRSARTRSGRRRSVAAATTNTASAPSELPAIATTRGKRVDVILRARDGGRREAAVHRHRRGDPDREPGVEQARAAPPSGGPRAGATRCRAAAPRAARRRGSRRGTRARPSRARRPRPSPPPRPRTRGAAGCPLNARRPGARHLQGSERAGRIPDPAVAVRPARHRLRSPGYQEFQDRKWDDLSEIMWGAMAQALAYQPDDLAALAASVRVPDARARRRRRTRRS